MPTPAKPRVEKTSRPSADLSACEQCGTAIPKTFEETTLEELDGVIDINVRGTFVATQAALKHMKSGGRIIMIGFVLRRACHDAGWCPTRPRGSSEDLHSGVVQEVGTRGITVNISAGSIDTD